MALPGIRIAARWIGGAELFRATAGPSDSFRRTRAGGNWTGEPYTVAEGSKFNWFRSRIVGGRTNHYGRISLRYADYDLKPYTRDGIGTDWPISYEDIAPYYDKAERFIGVTGSKEGIRSAPDGVFQPCPPPRVHEVLIKKAAGQAGHSLHSESPGGDHAEDQRAPGVPLLRRVRTRVHPGVELFVQPGADVPGDEDRQGRR